MINLKTYNTQYIDMSDCNEPDTFKWNGIGRTYGSQQVIAMTKTMK